MWALIQIDPQKPIAQKDLAVRLHRTPSTVVDPADRLERRKLVRRSPDPEDRRKENLVLVGPAGTGKSHLLIALGHAAVSAGPRVRYFAAVDLVEDLYRGLADNSVGKILDGLLRSKLVLCHELGFAPLDARGSQLLFRFVAAMYERRSMAIASHWPFEEWGRFLRETVTATSLLDRVLHHATVVVTSGESFRMKEARSRSAPRVRAPESPAAMKAANATR